MKFLDLEIENFLAITQAKISLADRGLVLIQGINNADSSAESNGAGKSSIADALSWVLYGVTARDVTGDDVINDTAGKNTRVQVQILDGAFTYRIARHRKHKPNKNQLQVFQHDGLKEIELTKGTEKLTQDVVLKIVGASHEVFVGAVYAGQERMPDLPNMTDKALKLLIEEAAGVTVLEEAYRIARDDYNAANFRLKEATDVFEDIARQLGWVRDQISTTRASITHWENRRTTEIQVQTEEIQAIVRDVKAIDISYDLAGAEQQVAELDLEIGGSADEQREFLRLDRDASLKEAAVKACDTDILVNTGALTRAEKELANVEHKVGCPCDECGRPLTEDELTAATDAARKRVEAYEKAIEEAGKRKDAALDEHKSALAAVEAFATGMTDISAASARRASLTAEIVVHNDNVARRNAKLTRARTIKEQIEREKAATNPHEPGLTKFLAQETELKDKAAKQRAIIDELTAEVDLEVENVKTFGPAGARATILDEVTPFLNDRTAKYLSTLSDGNIEATWSTLTANSKGELKEKFTIDVTNRTGGKVFKAISGGEKKKVRVATALALQDLVATRATKPIDFFMGDEIDGALDPAGLERLTQVLQEKADERGTVFVISHLELRDWISNVIQVEKSATGETTITEMAA